MLPRESVGGFSVLLTAGVREKPDLPTSVSFIPDRKNHSLIFGKLEGL